MANEINAGVTTNRLADGTLQCKKCKRFLGRMNEGVLEVGSVQIWNEARFSCAGCGKVYYYGEEVPERASEHEESTRKILLSLASAAKYKRDDS